MARKKAQRKQETTLVPHRTPNLSALLERAKTGDSTQALKAYFDAGGTLKAHVEAQAPRGQGAATLLLPLLHHVILKNAHPHRELSESVRLLLAAGADINASYADPSGDNPTLLMCAAWRTCCAKVPEVLLRAGADPCVHSSPMGFTALHQAARAGTLETCELLLARGSDVLLEARDVNDWTALMHAVGCGSLDIVRFLLQCGANIEAADNLGVTPLIGAAVLGSVSKVACLLEAGADANAVQHDGISALALLAANSQVNSKSAAAVIELLLSHGADIKMTDTEGQTALFRPAYEGNIHMMEFLVQRGFSVHAVDDTASTLLMAAARSGHKHAAEWLLHHGVAVNAANKNSYTALHSVCRRSDCDDAAMIELLLASGADVRRCDAVGETALDVAARRGNVQCAKVLIAAGADVNHLSAEGLSSLHTAILAVLLLGHHNPVVDLLLEHGAAAVVNKVVAWKCVHGVRCCIRMTALMMCVEPDTVKALIAAGANVHITTDGGDTCLHKAAKHSAFASVICVLIKAGVDLNALNNEGKTAAQLAHDRGHTLIEQVLIRAAQQGR
jgi:uncharacterized protein